MALLVPGQDDTFKAHTDGHAYGDKLLHRTWRRAVDVFVFSFSLFRLKLVDHEFAKGIGTYLKQLLLYSSAN